jgi:uncharacterized protein (TIGR03083 family)
MDYPALIQTEADALLAAATQDLGAAVPSCPGWDNRRLLGHVGRVLASTAAHVPRGVVEPPPFNPRPPAEDDALVQYFEQALAATLAAFRDVSPSAPAWNFTTAAPVASFWPRRMANELQVHAWDAEGAVGVDRPLNPALAADGIDEVLRVLVPTARATGLAAHADGTAHIHLEDTPGEWMVTLAGERVEVQTGHEKGDVGLRGPAGPVLLALWGRVAFDAPGLTAFGDTSLLAAISPGR